MLGRIFNQEIERYNQEVAPRLGNVEQWRNDYELYPTQPNTRWKNASNVPAPFTHIYCQSHQTRLNQQIVQADPPFAVIARSQAAVDNTPQIEEAMASILEEAEWATHADDVHYELPQVGNCLVRVTWEQQWGRAPRFQYDQNVDAFNSLTAAGQPPLDSYAQSIETDEEGSPTVTFAWENVLTKSGVAYQVIPWEDCLILPATVRDPFEAYGIGERLMIRGIELEQGARMGKYYEDEVRAVLNTGGDAQPYDRTERLNQQGISPEAGVGSFGGINDALYKEFLCYEFCWQMDVDNDGQFEWVVVTFHPDTKRVLRCQYLPYEHGRPFYIPFGYFRRPRELWAMSVAEKIAAIQDAATSILNQLIDHADLILNLHGNFFYDGTSGFDPAKQPVKLGQPIKVTNIEGIKLIDISPLPAEHYNVYQMLKDMADLITASSNPSLGKTTDTQKTLGEIQIVTGASSMIFEEVASRVARTWAIVYDHTRWLWAQFGQGGNVRYRVAAKPGVTFTDPLTGQQQPGAMVNGQVQPAPNGFAFGQIPADMLLSDVDIVPAGLKRLSDMQSRLQQATIVNNVVLTNPLTMQNPEALAITLDYFLQQAGFPQKDKLMGAVFNQIAQQAAAAAAAAQMGLAGGGAGAGPPGGSPPENNPSLQGPQGNPAALPEQAPTPIPNAPSADATAQSGGGGP